MNNTKTSIIVCVEFLCDLQELLQQLISHLCHLV
jgi:hypothetical protein